MKDPVKALRSMLSPCTLCPLQCGARRLKGEEGLCGGDNHLRVWSMLPSRNEEQTILNGGAVLEVFITGCSLRCKFCQNEHIARTKGEPVTSESLAESMLNAEKAGAVGIMLLTPTHVAPWLVEASLMAKEQGLTIPVIWNTSGYERPEVVRLAAPAVDIFLPDFKFGTDQAGMKYANVPYYTGWAKAALRAMIETTGIPRYRAGRMVSGVLVRHLILPNDAAASLEVLNHLRLFKDKIVLSLMTGYRVVGAAWDDPTISRPLFQEEVQPVIKLARKIGFTMEVTEHDEVLPVTS